MHQPYATPELLWLMSIIITCEEVKNKVVLWKVIAPVKEYSQTKMCAMKTESLTNTDPTLKSQFKKYLESRQEVKEIG